MIPVSVWLPALIGLCLVGGFLLTVAGFVWSSKHPIGRSRPRIAAGCGAALLLNAWWIGFMGMVFWKIVILKQDP